MCGGIIFIVNRLWKTFSFSPNSSISESDPVVFVITGQICLSYGDMYGTFLSHFSNHIFPKVMCLLKHSCLGGLFLK